MADLSQITLPNGNTYNFKDTAARESIPTKTSDLVNDTNFITDVQVNSASVVSSGVANVPKMAANTLGVAKVQIGDYGLTVTSDGEMRIYSAFGSDMKGGSMDRRAITPKVQHESVFYGLAKAAGDSTQSASSNAVGTYTATAIAAIQTMIDCGPGVEVVRLL